MKEVIIRIDPKTPAQTFYNSVTNLRQILPAPWLHSISSNRVILLGHNWPRVAPATFGLLICNAIVAAVIVHKSRFNYFAGGVCSNGCFEYFSFTTSITSTIGPSASRYGQSRPTYFRDISSNAFNSASRLRSITRP